MHSRPTVALTTQPSQRAPLVAWLIAPVNPAAGALQVLRCGCWERPDPQIRACARLL